jgi:hypothetical protein
MADLQKYFKEFHDEIRLGYNDNSILLEKRDTVLRDLRIGLRKMFGAKYPKFKHFRQGSYALGTGVYPLDSDYDIDIGIIFEINRKDFCPTQVKSWVHDALYTKNRTVYYKRPCLTVQYHHSGVEDHHIDLAVYTTEITPIFNKTNYYIAKGYVGSEEKYKIWELAEPFELLNCIKKKFTDAEDQAQFRRVIRYLKRWNDYNFYSAGNAKPRGIAITALAYNLFRPNKTFDWNLWKHRFNDLKALRDFVSSIIKSFDRLDNIAVKLPVKPNNNLFDKMTNKQMKDYKERLSTFKVTLDLAVKEKTIEDACYAIWQEFGDDFPTPGFD